MSGHMCECTGVSVRVFMRIECVRVHCGRTGWAPATGQADVGFPGAQKLNPDFGRQVVFQAP